MTRHGTAPSAARASGGWRVQGDGCVASRWPRPTRFADTCGSIVAIVRDKPATPTASETAHAGPSNAPVHGETSLDVRCSELAGCSLRAGREHYPAGAEGVTPVQGAARRHRPHAN